jgi:O-antigen/teichoic acid export membrane protein
MKKRLHRVREHLKDSPIAYRLARGAFWSMVGGVASRIFTMVSAIVIARLLGKEGFGEIGMVQSTMGLFGVLAGFGLGSTATKYIAEYRHKDPERAGRISSLTVVFSLLSGLLMMVLCLALSPWLAQRTLGRPDLASLLAAGSLLMFVSTIGGVLSAALSGYEAFRKIAKINIMQGAAAPLMAIPLVWYFGGQGAIASFTINGALGLILCARALKGESDKYKIPDKYDISIWREWPVLWKFAFPAMTSGLMMAPVTWITNIILVNQPDGYGELGLFNAANQWRMVVIFLPGLLTAAMLPVLSETHGREDKGDFHRTVILNLRATWIVALPLTVLAVTMGKPLAALFGKQFHGTAPIIAVLMVAAFLNVVNSAVGSALAGAGRMWTGTLMNLGWAVVLVASAVFLVPRLGGLGLATAYLVSYLAHTVWVMTYVEIKLARFSISAQWPLILFSALLLAASLGVSTGFAKQYVYHLTLIVLSFIPLIKMVRTKLPRLAE